MLILFIQFLSYETKSLAESTDFSPHTIRQYAFSINSIQLFVYMITPLLNVINEKDLTSNFRLESGLKIWQSLWQYRQPEVLCFCAPVKQRRIHLPFITMVKKEQPTSAVQGIYLGINLNDKLSYLISNITIVLSITIKHSDEGETISRRLSNVPAQIANPPPYSNVPPPKPPRPYLAVLSSLSKQKEGGEAEIPAIQVSATSGFDRQQQQQMLSIKKPNNLEISRSSAIVRSVSDYHTSDIPRIFTKSHTTAFDETSPSSYKGMRELDDALNFVDDKSLSNAMDDAEVSAEKAPLVALQEICSGISADFENTSHSACEVVNFSVFFFFQILN
ncbi:unnamed protein product [Wuchereria bancrofti]|uniref:Cation channel complex component UNC80 N-terminal domain-containing protein n=1 Tax=Wuchereria bancrofti TaxID=6293 RepID=A0A3P7FWZ7_WUCBA|nr:unnamed protein product [Wuchereria bancrofti]